MDPRPSSNQGALARYRRALASGDPRMSSDGPTRWAAVRATKTRCRNCYDDIVQLQPDGWWVDVESETPTCTRNIHHEPLAGITR